MTNSDISANDGEARENSRWEWHNAASFPRHGQGWTDTAKPFDRLPSRAAEVVRPAVWALSRDSAGVYVEFVTDARAISVRWRLSRERLEMWHMAATGVSGLDLYVKKDGHWRWAAVGGAQSVPDNESILLRGLAEEEREFRLYLPLYNGIESLEIGVPAGAKMTAVSPPEDRLPIVFYGTSITQGACASRPGMAYPAIVGRRLQWPVINLGFSGNGQTEPEVAGLLAELDTSVFVIDSLPNVESAQVQPRIEAFVRILRESHPEVPIVLVENVVYTDSHINDWRQRRVEGSNEALQRAFENLTASGPNGLHYVEAGELFGEDGEDTVDGVHPTDIGLSRIADGLESALRPILVSGAGKAR